jgi:hypothetical protein
MASARESNSRGSVVGALAAIGCLPVAYFLGFGPASWYASYGTNERVRELIVWMYEPLNYLCENELICRVCVWYQSLWL